jgi:DNA gyrase subunit A
MTDSADEVRARLHIYEALATALADPHRVLDVLLDASDIDTATAGLKTQFGLTDIQAAVVLDQQFRRLIADDRERIRTTLTELRERLQGDQPA